MKIQIAITKEGIYDILQVFSPQIPMAVPASDQA